MKRLLLLLAALSTACALHGGTVNNPFVTPRNDQNTAYCAALDVHTVAGQPLQGAAVSIGGLSGVTNKDGYLYLQPVPSGVQTLLVSLANYVPYKGEYQIDSWNCGLPVSLVSAHVDPSTLPLNVIAAVRGAMWPQGLGLPLGPRPNAPDNIIATDFFHNFSLIDQQRILDWENANHYTHVVVGPLVDSDGYHGIYRPTDWRQHWDEFLDIQQQFWDNIPADHSRSFGQVPVTFIHPDGWTFEQTRDELTPLLQQPRAQKLIRFAVVSGWEPTKYGWSSCTWAKFVAWGRQVLPNAVIAIHTVADVDAPVGTDALCDDNGHPNGEGWQRVADSGLHVWLVQNGAYTTAPADDPSLAYNFAGQFSTGPDGAATHGAAWHFENGVASWPTNSGWGRSPIHMVNAEVTSYTAFWSRIGEVARQAWGDLCMMKDACFGYLDGGTVAVPAR